MSTRVPVLLLYLLITIQTAFSNVPPSYEDYGEPDTPIFAGTPSPAVNRQVSLQRLTAVREVMKKNNVDAFVVPTADAHNSQYIAPSDARREWLSGLSGSSGTALVTPAHALVWTDGRYFTQFEIEVDTTVWSLMRQGTDLSIQDWLVQNMPQNSIVGIDPTTYTRSAWTPLEDALRQNNVTLMPIYENIVDEARKEIGDPAPARPSEQLIALTANFTGKVSSEKISELLRQIRARNAAALVLTALDDVAYTLNIRGTDIPYNPVFFAYLIIRADLETNNVILFWGDDGHLAPDIQDHLTSEGTQVLTLPYSRIFQYLRDMTMELEPGSSVWLSRDGSQAVYLAAEENSTVSTFSTVSPVALMKCVKNNVELKGFRSAHVKDGVAVIRFLRWVHEQVAAGLNVTEIDVVDKLDELRGEEQLYRGPSFATIAGAGENGAIIHYKPSREGEQRVLRREDMLLVDSGAQYVDGTTDITRTRHLSSPTAAQRRAFTRVMKGQILLGTAVFPRGTTGNILETLARKALWDVGLNYAHGTGHGVGHYLNVHEGPSGIGAALMVGDPGIVPGMIFSNEPGYYEVGEYGIRHEDLVEVIEMNKDADHIFAKGMVGDFLGRGAVAFHTLSLAPHQTACLDVELLNDDEIRYLNGYHARVLATLGPILKQRELNADYEWLERECAPIRSAAILATATPFLIFSTISLWLSGKY